MNNEIKTTFQALKKALAETQMAAIRELAGCTDEVLLARISETLICAASHTGSNPAWRNQRCVSGSSQIVSWYQQGIDKVNEARAMIEQYNASKNSAGECGQ